MAGEIEAAVLELENVILATPSLPYFCDITKCLCSAWKGMDLRLEVVLELGANLVGTNYFFGLVWCFVLTSACFHTLNSTPRF